jgi:hypothetical protein
MPADRPPVFDPVENAKVMGATPLTPPTPKKAEPPPPPPAQVKTEPAPKPKKRFLVMKTRYISVPGNAGMTQLAEGTVVSEQTHDMSVLRSHGILLEPLPD